MRETPNLLLKLPDPTDYVQVEDLNENFTKIDTELKRVEDSVPDAEVLTNIEQSVTNLDEKMTQHLTDTTPHKFSDGTTTYKYGFKTNTAKDGLIFVYEEVV